jgi:predicted aldo/keto reductase-like oxidoreductase
VEKVKLGNTGLEASCLGFGAMRLPMVDIGGEEFVDLEKAAEVIRYAYDCGINYFDSGLLYCSGESEFALREGLAGIRDRVILTTKATKFHMKNPGDLRRMLEHQLARLGTDYLDFYCFHGIGWDSFQELDKTTGWLADMNKAHTEGLVRNIAFSFHDTPENMVKLIDLGIFSMVTCQYNYLDQKNAEAIQHAHDNGLAVVVMGPLGGGRLTGMPGFVKAEHDIKFKTAPEMALRFVISHAGVSVALSGMGSKEMVDQNIAAVEKGVLKKSDLGALEALMKKTNKLADLYCTGCGYCMPCPKDVDIKGRFAAMNMLKVYGIKDTAVANYSRVLDGEQKKPGGGKCVKCGLCEKKCPQNIKIIEQLEETEKTFNALIDKN